MKFIYQARTQKGEIQSGTVEASSYEAAVDILQRHQLIITSLQSVEEAPLFARKIEIPTFFQRVSLRDVAIFSRQLSVLFASEVPLVESLRVLAEQTQKPDFKVKIFKIADDIDAGTAFSKALSKYPQIFSTLYVNLVRAGEVSGKLSETLSYLADHYEREYNLVSKIRGSMFYPAFIFITMIIVVTIMLLFVIPNLTAVLEESGQELPLITQVIIGLTKFLRTKGYILLIILILGIFVFLHWRKTPEGKEIWDKFILKLPVFGQLLQKIYLARFAENLGTLIIGGLPISRALEITAAVVGNETYKKVILEAEAGIRRGEFISTCFKVKKEIPPLVTQMLRVGEKTGKLDTVLKNVADFYLREVARMTENMVSLLEPLMILTLGIGVGFLVVGVLLPIYNMAGQVLQ